VTGEGRLLEGQHGFRIVDEEQVREAHVAVQRGLSSTINTVRGNVFPPRK